MAFNKAFAYSVYVLFLLLLAYLLNQLDRYMVAIVNIPMAQDIHYGEMACMKNVTFTQHDFYGTNCSAKSEQECDSLVNINGTQVCDWNYNGMGFEYQILAGPLFILIYTFVGIPFGIAADVNNRKILLAVSVIFWSAMTLLMGFVKSYWQLAVLRFGQGVGQAGCTPFATSIIADYFDVTNRASALGFYNWGIYIGYSLSFALGNVITKANIMGQGWRWAFIISGIPGLLLGPLIIFSLKEPERHTEDTGQEEVQSLLGAQITRQTKCDKLKAALKPFTQPTLLLLVLAGSVRNGAGYVWAYNTQNYYHYLGQTPEQIATYMSWIPLVGGCIGVVLGGYISDKFIKKIGPHARLVVLVVSQLVASPFVAGALFLSPPWAYLSLLPGYIVGEMWVGITLAVGLELVPPSVKTTAVAVYLFIITNIGGNMPLLVPPLVRAFLDKGYTSVESTRAALYILYPGMYVLGALLFLVTLFSLKRDLRIANTKQQSGLTSESDDENTSLLRE